MWVLKEQNGLVSVEAKNSVLSRWAPIRADGASGATGYQGTIDPVAGFVLWEKVSGKEKEVLSQG